jgi:hypothetical protein
MNAALKTVLALVALLVFAGGTHLVVQSQARTAALEAAADRFFSDPGFTEDYTVAAEWEEVQDRDSSDPSQVMLARRVHGSR